MPQNITDANAFTSPIVAPADGDGVNASSVLTGFQGLANRTNYLNLLRGAANGIATLNGSSQVPVAQLPVNIANGVCGLNGSTLIPLSLIPFGISLGVPQLDGSSRLPAATVRNGLIAVGSTTTGAPNIAITSWSSASYVDIITQALTLTNGDIVMLWVSFNAAVGSGGAPQYSLTVVDPSAVAHDVQVSAYSPWGTQAEYYVALVGTYTAAATGSHTLKARGNNFTGAITTTVYGQATLAYQQFRP